MGKSTWDGGGDAGEDGGSHWIPSPIPDLKAVHRATLFCTSSFAGVYLKSSILTWS